jgi:hypothetical protein
MVTRGCAYGFWIVCWGVFSEGFVWYHGVCLECVCASVYVRGRPTGLVGVAGCWFVCGNGDWGKLVGVLETGTDHNHGICTGRGGGLIGLECYQCISP